MFITNRYNPTEKDLLLITDKATAKILNIPVKSIFDLVILENKVIVTYGNFETTEISKDEYLQHFQQSRKNRSHSLGFSQAPNNPNLFAVINYDNGNQYLVETSDSEIHCQCEDFKRQAKILTNPICKHGYTILRAMGLDSIENYIKRNEDLHYDNESLEAMEKQDYYHLAYA